MSPRLTRTDLAQTALIWLLTVTWDGQVYRFSTRPIDVTDEDGEGIPFGGGLPDIDFEEDAGILDVSPELKTVAIEVVFPVDVALRIEGGHDLSAAEGELAYIRDGDALEDRQIKLVGSVVEPEYGADGEPVRFSLEENAYDDTAITPAAGAVVSEATWPSSTYTVPDASVGLYYPQVFGTPGVYVDATGAAATGRGSPAVVVHATGSTANRVVVAGHRVTATQVTIVDEDASTEVFSISQIDDGLGRSVATVDLTAAAVIDRTQELWVAWTNGKATIGVTGAGSLLRIMLNLSSLRVDRGRIAALEPFLDRFDVSGYFDTAVVVWDWVQDNLLPILPVSMQSGPSGLFPVLWRYDALPADSVADFIEGENCTRASQVTYDRGPREVVNEIRATYALDGIDGALRILAHTPGAEAGTVEQTTSRHSQISAARYGTIALELETDIVWTDRTMRLILAWMILSKALPTRLIEYQAGDDLTWPPTGSIVTLTSDDIHIDQIATLYRRSYTDTGLHSFVLLVQEQL
ncbi:hypothetical protein CMI37_16035 [Candidatus Pacearchaeota archaeon]|nr:hypothetical protein [Candidatus Pacearchaeota archaeon]